MNEYNEWRNTLPAEHKTLSCESKLNNATESFGKLILGIFFNQKCHSKNQLLQKKSVFVSSWFDLHTRLYCEGADCFIWTRKQKHKNIQNLVSLLNVHSRPLAIFLLSCLLIKCDNKYFD